MSATAAQVQHEIDSWSGGSDGRTRHPFNRRFIYTEGVKAVADLAGAYWALDILATEVAQVCLSRWGDPAIKGGTHFFNMKVVGGVADLWLEVDSGQPKLWHRHIEYTDFPDGDWVWYLCIDGVIDAPAEVLVALLPSEY